MKTITALALPQETRELLFTLINVALGTAALILSLGCATYRSDQIEIIGTNGVRIVRTTGHFEIISTNGIRVVNTQVNSRTLWDSTSELTKLRLSTTDKSQITTLGSLNQESSSTNIVSLFEAVARGAAAGAGKTVVPIP